jgi:cyclopropane fatty-acyl-phospholipid synthase-like methyltransferase
MAHKDEYPPNMVTLLELIWGKGYMAPGGSGNVAKILGGIKTDGKRILDIGCGIGGPTFEMARNYGAQTVGIDLESALIKRAQYDAAEAGLGDRCSFQTVTQGPLPFPDSSFDIVTSAGAFTQTSDKPAILAECMRVLRPGGYVSCYEWQKADGIADDAYSEDMRYWFELEELTYAMESLKGYETHLRNIGFTDVSSLDATDWYCAEARREYELLKGDLNSRMIELIGQNDADHFVEDWRAMVVVIEKGEMRQGYCRGRRPLP